jgi:Tat protein secretion system quality control protein TatD with DNase activity
MRKSLLDNPQSAVGEIGLDGARYDPNTGELCTPMARQVEAFEIQLRMAAEMERPVSIHAVRAWGPLLDTLNKKFGKKKGDKPPRMYFHAFGGKAAQVNQIRSACGGTDEVFYGFAPCVNFRSPKTADVIRAIGINSLVLESDRENYKAVQEDLEANAQFISDALHMSKDEVVRKTSANARRFFGLP